MLAINFRRPSLRIFCLRSAGRKIVTGMDELDDARLDGVELFVLDASFDALFDAGLIATVGKHGLAEQPLRAARADPAVSEEEDGAVSENEDGAGACVVGPGRPRSATIRARKTPKNFGDLTSFEEGLTLYLMRADNRFKCSEAHAHGKVSDLRRSVGSAQGIIRKSHLDATAPVSATDLAALRNPDRVLADLETVSSDRAKQLLGTIL